MTDTEKIKVLAQTAGLLWDELLPRLDTDGLFHIADCLNGVGMSSKLAEELFIVKLSSDLWACEDLRKQLEERCLEHFD